MPEPRTALSDDETRAEFARMREAALRQTHIPGAAAVRRSVHRRRRVATASAGLAVVAVAGGLVVALTPRDRQIPTTPPAVSHGALSSSTGPTPPPSLPTEGSLYGIPRSADGSAPLEVPLEMMRKSAAAGLYRFNVLCSGSGGGLVTLTTGQETATARITCDTPPALSAVQLHVTSQAAVLTLRVEWDPGTVLRDTAEGWAIQVVGVDND